MPLIHATRAPTQEPAPFAGIPRGGTFESDLDGKVPEAVVVRRDLLFSLAEVSCLTRPSACRRVVGLCTGLDWIPVSSFHSSSF